MVEVSRIGFTLLPSTGVSEGLPRVNIIFVHGLRGHPRQTWVAGRPDSGAPSEETLKSKRRGKPFSWFAEAKNDPDNGVFWPEELLAHDIPEARVWTYGFNADVIDGMFGANNRNKVTQHSGDLAVRLEREINNQDPIIFVAHSLGGVLVKDALARSQDTCAKTKAVIFLGTPHRGSKSAGWGTTVANLSKLLLQDVNDKILRNLEVHGEMLEKIDGEFKFLVQKYNFRIHSFQEGRGISGVRGFHGKIVEDFSSKLGLPRNMETVETMDADHREMARCHDRSDPKYKAICEVLRQIVVDAPGSSRTGGGVVSVRKPVSNETGEVHGRVGSFLVPYLRNGRFVGRQSIVHALLNQPVGENSQSRTALFGLGGVGKTQIAIEYAYRIRDAQREVSVFWVFAANEERFKEGYASIAQHYNIPGYNDHKIDLLSLVQKWLLKESHGSWIMIVDNADGMDVMCNQPLNLGQYLPECSHGSILITTRMPLVTKWDLLQLHRRSKGFLFLFIFILVFLTGGRGYLMLRRIIIMQ
ncbi:Alpha/Beta hydrolase protein [Cladorrhinum sp. PSN259]|nr:Alpha/Beta hydrolase protein [Cladorrhinum sp. PSN259]